MFVLELRENASSAPLYSGRMRLLKRLGVLPCLKNGINRWPHIWKVYLPSSVYFSMDFFCCDQWPVSKSP